MGRSANFRFHERRLCGTISLEPSPPDLDDIGGLELEPEFSFISKRFVKKDLYHGDANLFDWTFNANQKKVIFYLLSLMSREYLRRRRKWMIPDLD